ncbi:MFS transporter [Janibacter indicus]|uniref:Predicted arabinose efflux permease, MFS family n=1 Tax=Janibacter indicus TaxID=857417 RepID=A0A1W2BFW6_9MICO|nr:MFS transporter [Janibacter indicus]SMC71714.1 Predicted arabinose efflux permease, MFS family [Janibacter indicus]
MSIPALQRRTVATLAGSQVLGGVGVSAGAAVGALLAADVSGSETWAGLGGTAQTLGGALAALVVARVMAAKGRRPGLTTGYLMAIFGGLLIVAASVVGSFAVLLVGFLLFGGATAANSQARFAATDLADDAHRGRHLSVVVWATTIGAVAGPNLTGPGQWVARQLHLPALVGPYVLSLVGIALAALVLTAALRPDPLLTARSLQVDHDEPDPTAGLEGEATRGWAVIRTRPDALMGVVAMALGHVVMVSVMIMTPLHMRHGHAGLEIIGLVISLHVVGMYAFSPLTGWAVDRWGSRAVIAVGAGVLLTASLLAASTASGHSLRLTAALVLLGMGWSCTLIAGSTLLTAAVPLRQRPAAQGLSDVAMGLAGGGGGALAGVVVGWWGYPALGLLAGGAALLLGLLVPLGRRSGC